MVDQASTKKILFYIGIYWDAHWMHNVIKAMNGDVYIEPTDRKDESENTCKALGYNIVPSPESYQIVVLSQTHLGQHRRMCDYFMNTGGSVVIMQHAWDSSIHLRDRFWANDNSKFTRYLVGSKQDYDWLSAKWGQDRIKFTGLPKLDDLYRVKENKKSLDHIYKKLGVNEFLLSITPNEAISTSIYYDYKDRLQGETNIPIVFKIHPGGDHDKTVEFYKNDHKNFIIATDDRVDLENTYELIKASRGVVCVESFMAIEASLLEKPLILYGYNSIPADFWNREENTNQNQRLALEMSSSFSNLEYRDKQREIADLYLFDGKNTERTVKALQELL